MAHVTAAQLSVAGPLFLEQRRRAVIDSPRRVGLDYVIPRRAGPAVNGEEVWDLELHFLPAGAPKRQAGVEPLPAEVTPANLRITLGELHDPGVRIHGVAGGVADGGGATLVARVHRDPPTAGVEATDSPPVYTLELLGLPRVDRFFRQARFVFRDGGHDPGLPAAVPALTEPREIPEIDYLAKDYESFRRLMLERLRAFVPSWQETHVADLGVTVVELLAHAADYLSYYQDAAATEAYVATARRRISVRRHARLVDYRLHEGCNARCWVQLKVERDREVEAAAGDGGDGGFELPAGIEVLTYCGHLPSIIGQDSQEHRKALLRQPLVFRTLEARTLRQEHNRIEIYTWGTESFALPAGTTSAALRGHLELRAGEVLVFERRRDPGAETAEDVDPRERQAVRLCRTPRRTTDLAAEGEGEPVAITEVEWLAEDALADDFPVSARIGGKIQRGLTVVRGNLIPADHGKSCHEVLEPVPAEGIYNPRLKRQGLTHRVPHDPEEARLEPAAGALRQDPRQALPDLDLYPLEPEEVGGDGAGIPPGELRSSRRLRWHPRHDLLSSHRFAHDFVVEVDDDGFARLRFGDDEDGRRPSPGTVFQAVYRVGLGPAGNVGAYSLRHAVVPRRVLERARRRGFRLVEVKNHLAGGGGLDRESLEKARLFAPEALRSRGSRQSCITERDYVEIAERHPDVLRAAARQRWTGSWKMVELFVQRPGGRPVDDLFRRRLQGFMAPHLVAGWELEISPPRYVPLDVRLTVWPPPAVERESLPRKLGDRVAAGEVNFLRPGYFTFGKKVYKSEVIAEVMALPEVADVEIEVFQRWGRPARGELEAGEIPILPLEIAQLDNDPSAPHRGILQITLGEPS